MEGKEIGGGCESLESTMQQTNPGAGYKMTADERKERLAELKMRYENFDRGTGALDFVLQNIDAYDRKVLEIGYEESHPAVKYIVVQLRKAGIMKPQDYLKAQQSTVAKIEASLITLVECCDKNLKELYQERTSYERKKCDSTDAITLLKDEVSDADVELRALNDKYISLKSNGYDPRSEETPDKLAEQIFRKKQYLKSLNDDKREFECAIKESVRRANEIESQLVDVGAFREQIQEMIYEDIKPELSSQARAIDLGQMVRTYYSTHKDAAVAVPKLRATRNVFKNATESIRTMLYGRRLGLPKNEDSSYESNDKVKGVIDQIQKKQEERSAEIEKILEEEKVRGLL